MLEIIDIETYVFTARYPSLPSYSTNVVGERSCDAITIVVTRGDSTKMVINPLLPKLINILKKCFFIIYDPRLVF